MDYDPNELQAPPAPEAVPGDFEEQYEPIDDIDDLPVDFGLMGHGEAASSDPNIVLHFASEPMGRRRKNNLPIRVTYGDPGPFFSLAP